MASASQQNDTPHGDHQKGEQHAVPRGGVVGTVYQSFMRDVRGGTLAALGREGMKDIQDTFHEAAWGNSGHGHEPGGPLTPLHSDIEEARDLPAARSPLPSPSDIAKGRGVTPQGEGTVHGRTTAMPTPGDIAKGRDTGDLYGKGNTQLAQLEVGVFMSEEVPTPGPIPGTMPEPTPQPMPEPSPIPEGNAGTGGNATQGPASRPGPHAEAELERLSNAKGERPGSMTDRIAIRRGDAEGGNRPSHFADRELAREGRDGEGDAAKAAKEERSQADEQRLRRDEQERGRER